MVSRLCGETTALQRTIVSYRAMLINLVCGFVSAVCLGFSFYGTIRLSQYVETVARASTAGSLMHGLTGLTVASFVVSMVGIYVCFALYGRYGEHRGGMLRPFALSYLSSAACVALTVAAAFFVVSSLILPHIAQTRNMLSASVHQYGAGDATLRSTIDEMHAKLHCCGADGYGDWSRIFWVSNASVTSRKELAVPRSCCDQAAHSRCVTSVPGDLPEVLTVYKRGCSSVLKQHLRFNLTIQAALVLIITILHSIVVLYLFAMLFSREKHPGDAAQLYRHQQRLQQQKEIPLPVTQIIPASRRSSAAISHTSGQKRMTAASEAITETWDPRAAKTAKPIVKPASRVASQVVSEPAVGVSGQKAAKSGVRRTSSVRAATSVPVQKLVYANLPPPSANIPDDTYLVPVYADKPSAAAEGDYLVPVTDKPKPHDNIYEPLVPITKPAARPSAENLYESLGPAAPRPAALTEKVYEPLRTSASKTRSKTRAAYEPLRLQKPPVTAVAPPPLPPRPTPAAKPPPRPQMAAKPSATKIPAGPSQLRADGPPLPHQSTVAIAGSVWPAKLNTAPAPPPMLPPPPPPPPPQRALHATPSVPGVSAQPSAKYRQDLKFREDLKSVVKRAMEAQRQQVELAKINVAAPPPPIPAAAAAVQYETLPSSAAVEASRPVLGNRVPGKKVAEAMKMIEKNRATVSVQAGEPPAVPAPAISGPVARIPPPPPAPPLPPGLLSSTPPPPPPLPPVLPPPVAMHSASTSKYRAPLPPTTVSAHNTSAAVQQAPTQPPQLIPSLKKKSPPPPPPPPPRIFHSATKRPGPTLAGRLPTPVPSQPLYETVPAVKPSPPARAFHPVAPARMPAPVPSQPIYETVASTAKPSSPPRRVDRSPPPVPPPRSHRRSPTSPAAHKAKSAASNQASSVRGAGKQRQAANTHAVRTLKKLISVDQGAEPPSSASNKSRSPSPRRHHRQRRRHHK